MYIMNDAYCKKRPITISLIDLQNALSEVHHNLIEIVLK